MVKDVATLRFGDGVVAFHTAGDRYVIEVVCNGHHVGGRVWAQDGRWQWAVDLDKEQVLPPDPLPGRPAYGVDLIPADVYGWDRAHEMAAERASAGMIDVLSTVLHRVLS